MQDKKILLSEKGLHLTLQRLACQLIENHGDFSNTALIGLQPRGSRLLNKLVAILQKDHGIQHLKHGLLDITFYRDDFRRKDQPLTANSTEINFVIEGLNVVLVDDVLYTGRSIRSALTALQSFGRPDHIELLTLIDRRFSRHLPIQPDYRGRKVDAIAGQMVKVHWKEYDGEDVVYLLKEPLNE